MNLGSEFRNNSIIFATIFLPFLIIAFAMPTSIYSVRSGFDIMLALSWAHIMWAITIFFAFTFGWLGFFSVVLVFTLYPLFIIQILLRSPVKVSLAFLPGLIIVGGFPTYYKWKTYGVERLDAEYVFTYLFFGSIAGLPAIAIILLISFVWKSDILKSENSKLKIFRILLLSISLIPFIFTVISFYNFTVNN